MSRNEWMVLVLVGCGSVENDKKVDARTADSPTPVDSRDVDAPSTTPRCNPTAAFGAAEELPGLNTNSHEAGATLLGDEKTIFFYSNRPGGLGGTDIYVATRPDLNSSFGTPARLAVVNTAEADEWPSITSDGLYLYMDRYGTGTTGWDIYVASRSSVTVDFGTPTLVANVNRTGAATDANQMIMSNHAAIYFLSDRGGGNDIYRAARNIGGTFDTPVAVITAATSDESVAVTADELTLFYSSDGPNSMGMHDIYMVKRTTINDGFGQPQQAGVSTASTEHVSWVSPDGCNLYFFRLVGNHYDVFWARRPM